MAAFGCGVSAGSAGGGVGAGSVGDGVGAGGGVRPGWSSSGERARLELERDAGRES